MRSIQSAPLMDEDIEVQIHLVSRAGRIVHGSMFGYWLIERANQSDRRDAELMFLAQTTNGNHVYTNGFNRWGVGGDRAPLYDPQEDWVRVRLKVLF